MTGSLKETHRFQLALVLLTTLTSKSWNGSEVCQVEPAPKHGRYFFSYQQVGEQGRIWVGSLIDVWRHNFEHLLPLASSKLKASPPGKFRSATRLIRQQAACLVPAYILQPLTIGTHLGTFFSYSSPDRLSDPGSDEPTPTMVERKVGFKVMGVGFSLSGFRR